MEGGCQETYNCGVENRRELDGKVDGYQNWNTLEKTLKDHIKCTEVDKCPRV